jgi:hypothetical protein
MDKTIIGLTLVLLAPPATARSRTDWQCGSKRITTATDKTGPVWKPGYWDENKKQLPANWFRIGARTLPSSTRATLVRRF